MTAMLGAMTRGRRAVCCASSVLSLAFATLPATADESFAAEAPGPFARGSFRVSFLIGSGSTRTDRYVVLGGGFGYFLIDGLAVGLDYEAWLGGDPTLHRLSPETRYVLHFVPTLKPYAGVFYRRTFVADFADFDHVGARVGLYYAPDGDNLYIGGGVVFERLLDCDESVFVDCDAVYPELSIGLAF